VPFGVSRRRGELKFELASTRSHFHDYLSPCLLTVDELTERVGPLPTVEGLVALFVQLELLFADAERIALLPPSRKQQVERLASVLAKLSEE